MGKAKILIVEDDAVTVESMKLLLTQAGYDVSDSVTSGEEAVAVVPEILPDLILMDIKLNGAMDGIAAYEQIKKSHDMPVIFVSNYAEKEVIARAIQSAPSGYLAKPFKKAQLVNKIEKALAWRELLDE